MGSRREGGRGRLNVSETSAHDHQAWAVPIS